jgi:RHS repeat-associated protein
MNRNFFKILCALNLLFLAFSSTANNPKVYNAQVKNNSISGPDINIYNQPLYVVADPMETTPARDLNDLTWLPIDYHILQSDGRVVLKIKDLEHACPANFTASFDLRITYYKWNPKLDAEPEQYEEVVILKTFTVNYDNGNGKKYKEKDILDLEWAHQIKVEILNISNPAVSTYLTLEAEIDQERYKKVTANDLVTKLPELIRTGYDPLKNEIKLSFSTERTAGFATEYDVEWTFVESYDANGDWQSAIINADIFKFNSSRVTLKKNEYILNAIAEYGYLVYRVRAITWSPDKNGILRRVEGDWTEFVADEIYPSSSSLPVIDDYEKTKNWQYVCDYAEEGKSKEVITYYDGSLRPRQIVSEAIDEHISGQEEKYVVVQDKIYDYQGRLAIEVLPTPIKSAKMQFYEQTSMLSSTDQYSKGSFDKDIDGNACDITVDPMDINYGAAKYYSENSDWQDASNPFFQNYVPIAGGFPFMQTEYMPDNTGRIARKSGVGSDYTLGSGHETQYEYIRPNQPELDRLFGTEVGLAEHHQKNTVTDANGQISVSYINAKGQVIATALAGEQPTGMKALGSYANNAYNEGTAITVNLIDESDMQYSENALISSYSFSVAKATDYKFYYSLNAVGFEPDCVPEGYCNECVYDLEISLTNKCDEEQLNYGGIEHSLLKKRIGELNEQSYTPVCNSSSVNDYELKNDFPDENGYITVHLEKGSYTIYKKLTPSQDALEFYTQQFIANQNCSTLTDFQNEANAAIDLSGCTITCEQCLSQVGLTPTSTESEIAAARTAYILDKKQRFVNMGRVLFTDEDSEAAGNSFDELKSNCDAFCNTPVDMCEAIKQLLYSDVRPGGQYAKRKQAPAASTEFLWIADDADGADNYNILGALSGSDFSYKNAGTFPEFSNINYAFSPVVDGVKTKVASLTVDQFINYFDENWLEILIKVHPEYCKYTTCIQNQASFDYSYEIMNTLTYDEAKLPGNNFLTPAGSDPFFMNNACAVNIIPTNLGITDRMNNYKKLPLYLYYQSGNDVELIEEPDYGSNQVILSDANSKKIIKTKIGYIDGKTVAEDGDIVYDIKTGNRIGLLVIIKVNATTNMLKIVKEKSGVGLKYTYSMYDIPLMDLFCSDLKNNQSNRLYNCVQNGREKLRNECKEVKDRYWQMFKALYLANKGYLEYYVEKHATVAACKCTPVIPVVSQGSPELYKRVRRFYQDVTPGSGVSTSLYSDKGSKPGDPRISSSIKDKDALKDLGDEGIAEACSKQCQSYAEYWLNKLNKCKVGAELLTISQQQLLTTELIKVCSLGCDVNNPVGSSSVAPQYLEGGPYASEAQYKNFMEVLQNFEGGIYVSLVCDDILIKAPKPYGHDYFAFESPYADTCSCDQTKYNYFYNQGKVCQGNANPSNENCPCKTGSAVSEKIKSNLLIGKDADPEFKCKQCVGCLQLNQYYQAFKEKYPTIDEANVKFDELLVTFLNNELNLNQTIDNYRLLAKQCVAGFVAPTENSEFTDFEAYYATMSVSLNVPDYYKAPEVELWEMNQRPMIASGPSEIIEKHQSFEIREVPAFGWLSSIKTNSNIANDIYLTASAGEDITVVAAEPKEDIKSEIDATLKKARINATAKKLGDEGPVSDNTKPGVDACGCDKIFEVWKDNPTATDDELNQKLADKYGIKLNNFSKLKELCCKSYNGISIVPEIPQGQDDADEDPIVGDNGDDDNKEGGGNPEDETGNGDEEVTPEPEPGCTMTPGQLADPVWTLDTKTILEENANFASGLKFPGSLLCSNPDVVQVNICGCDKLVAYEAEAQALGMELDEFLNQEFGYQGTMADLTTIMEICEQARSVSSNAPQWDIRSVAHLFDLTSNPVITLPKEFRCNEEPEIPVVGGGCMTCGEGSTTLPDYCIEDKEYSCAQFSALIANYSNGVTQFLTPEDFEKFKDGLDAAAWDDIIGQFKTQIGLTPDSKCYIKVEFVDDEEPCGYPRNHAYSFHITKNTTRTSFMRIIENIALYGCGCITPPDWLRMSPVRTYACSDCYGPTKRLIALQNFFNELTATHETKTIGTTTVTYNKFFVHAPMAIPTTSAFDKTFNDGAGGLAYTWETAPPYVDAFYKMLISGPGFTTKEIILNFSTSHAQNKIYFIRKFSNIRPICPNPESRFLVDVELDVYDPYAQTSAPPEKIIVTIQGFMAGANLAKQFNCCAKLCNIPATKEDAIDPCGLELEIAASMNASYNYEMYIKKLKEDFQREYLAHCLNSANPAIINEQFKMKYNNGEYHYTLYYYDQAGNLVRTIPPEAIVPITSQATLNGIITARKADNINSPGNPTTPDHKFNLATNYQYNSLNQLIGQKTPDAGSSVFYYDGLGRLVFSRNARQVAAAKYSYTKYDALGRIIEVGELKTAATMSDLISRSQELSQNFVNDNPATEITKMLYDEQPILTGGSGIPIFQNLRNRVSATSYHSCKYPLEAYAPATYAAYYSYDIHGNVSRLVRYDKGLDEIDDGYKTVEYYYDLISGKVNYVFYQRDEIDQYMHAYKYDQSNRLVETRSGSTQYLLETDASYFYYVHGPLARTEIGSKLVQGVDYAYTIQGWLKAVNSASLNTARDMGRDADAATDLHRWVAADEFGYSLHYYTNDYAPVKAVATSAEHFLLDGSAVAFDEPDLFNGNIKMMVTSIGKLMGSQDKPLASGYTYDQLNRIWKAAYYNDINNAQNSWNTKTSMADWNNVFTYDANGNILTQVRNGSAKSGLPMDNLAYSYTTGTNKLDHVSELSGSNYNDDIKNQDIGNYTYDEIGNLIKDRAEEIASISWTVYGKISRIKRRAGSLKPDLEFQYTPDGHRALKVVVPKVIGGARQYTYYMRDAQGNILATYNRTFNSIIDYDKLTYSAVNDSLVTYAGGHLSDFANFIANINGTHTGLKTDVYTKLTANTADARGYLSLNAPIPFMIENPNVFNGVLVNHPNLYDLNVQYLNAIPELPSAILPDLGTCMWNNYENNNASQEPIKYLLMFNKELFFRGYAYTYPSEFELLCTYLFGYNPDFESRIQSLMYYETTAGAPNTSIVDNLIWAAGQSGIDLSRNYTDVGYILTGMYYTNPQATAELIAKLPNVQMRSQAQLLSSSFGGTLEFWCNDGKKEYLIRALYSLNATEAYDVMSYLGYATDNVNDASDYISGLSKEDVKDAFEAYGYVEGDAKLINLYEHLYMSHEQFFGPYYYCDYNSILMYEYGLPLDITQGLMNNPYVPGCYTFDITTMSNMMQSSAGGPQPLWDWMFQIENQTNNYVTWYKNNDASLDFIRKSTQYKRSWISDYQTANYLYSASGNGMQEYFGKIYDFFGPTFYDAFLNRFKKESRSYVDSLSIAEWNIYGSSRLGTQKAGIALLSAKNEEVYNAEEGTYSNGTNPQLYVASQSDNSSLVIGSRQYELTNHLGNVMVVVTNKKISVCTSGVLARYSADVVQATDYSPFGAPMADRSWTIAELSRVGVDSSFFASGTDGWANAISGITVTNSSQKLKFETSSTTNTYARKTYTGKTVYGGKYRMSMDVEVVALNSGTRIFATDVASGAVLGYAHVYTTGRCTFEFTAKGNNTNVNVLINGSTGTKTLLLDNIRLERISDGVESYRFGFNGKEADNEVYGAGNEYAFEYRIHDPRLGRFLSIDPMSKNFPWNSPYNFAECSPIAFIDFLGLSKQTRYEGEDGKLLADTKDGNNSTVVIKNDKRKEFDDWKAKSEKNGTLNNAENNMDFIRSVTPSSQGLHFTSSTYALNYMARASKANNIEYSGYLLNNDGFYVDATEGYDVNHNDYNINSNEEAGVYTKVRNGVITLSNGSSYTVKAHIHTHLFGFWSGVMRDPKTGNYSEVYPPGDIQAFTGSYFKTGAKISQFYMLQLQTGSLNALKRQNKTISISDGVPLSPYLNGKKKLN